MLLLLLSQPVLQRMQLLLHSPLPCPVGSLKWPYVGALTAFTSLRRAHSGCWLPALQRSYLCIVYPMQGWQTHI